MGILSEAWVGYPVGEAITERGRAFRDGVTARLDAWSQACIEAGAFPVDLRKRAAG